MSLLPFLQKLLLIVYMLGKQTIYIIKTLHDISTFGYIKIWKISASFPDTIASKINSC